MKTEKNKIPEITIKALIISIILAVILGAANAYLGLNVSITLFLGSALIWWLGIPVYSYYYPVGLTFESAIAIWKDHLCYIAIGGMLTGGGYAIYKLINPI